MPSLAWEEVEKSPTTQNSQVGVAGGISLKTLKYRGEGCDKRYPFTNMTNWSVFLGVGGVSYLNIQSPSHSASKSISHFLLALKLLMSYSSFIVESPELQRYLTINMAQSR